MCWINPGWIDEAVSLLKSNGIGVKAVKEMAALYDLDRLPWVAQFPAVCLARAGVVIPDVTAAIFKKYQLTGKWDTRMRDWGEALPYPVYGCLAGFERKGHYGAGFVMGTVPGESDRLVLLGAFRSDAICLARLRRANPTVFYRYPPKRRLVHVLPEFSAAMVDDLPLKDATPTVTQTEESCKTT